MTDYISREAANNALRECVRACPNSFYNGIEVARTAIHKLPAADVRPVVLCKDCKYPYFENDYGWCGYLDIGVNVNDFCSQGKREE